MKNYSDVLKSCIEVAEQRQADYGPAIKSIQDVSLILRETFGLDLDEGEVVKVIISLKLARMKNKWMPDHTIDLINYLAILHTIYDNSENGK